MTHAGIAQSKTNKRVRLKENEMTMPNPDQVLNRNNPYLEERRSARIKVTIEIDWLLPKSVPYFREHPLTDEQIKETAIAIVKGDALNYDWSLETEEAEILEVYES